MKAEQEIPNEKEMLMTKFIYFMFFFSISKHKRNDKLYQVFMKSSQRGNAKEK